MSDRQENNRVGWKVEKNLKLMYRRYDFSGYEEMRSFLDQLEMLSKSEAFYPDLTFSRAHVNVTIKAQGDQLIEKDYVFADKVDALIKGDNDV